MCKGMWVFIMHLILGFGIEDCCIKFHRLTLLKKNLDMEVPDRNLLDVTIWASSSSGMFSLSSAFQEIRDVRKSSFVCSKIWHSQVSLRVSFFMLRLLRGRLPLDDVLS